MGWKPPITYRQSAVVTPTPEPFTITGGVGLLAEAPASPSTFPMVVTVGGNARTRVTGVPAAGQYAVQTSMVIPIGGLTATQTEYLPLLSFHASDEGLSGTCSYWRTGTIITRELMTELVRFLRPLTGYTSANQLPPATTDVNTRGYPGDVAFLTDGSVWTSNGTTWTGLGA